MPRALSLRCCLAIAGLFASLLTFGCGSKGPAIAKDDIDRLNKIFSAYKEASDKLGHPPKNMDEFRGFIEKQGDPKVILRSPHDGEPYAIVWNCNLRQSIESLPPPLVAYEQKGADGQRHILTTMGLMTIGEEEFTSHYKLSAKK